MSFILDALKKSELERQRQAIPGLMDSGALRPRARFSLWAAGLVVLLGINLLVLLIVLTRGAGRAPPTPGSSAASAPAIASSTAPATQAPPATSPASASAPAPTPATSATAEHFSPLDAAPVYAPEIPADPSLDHAAPADSGTAVVRATHRRDPVLTDDYKPEEEALPSISEVNLTGPQALPDLHLDVHVFATNPAERFVYINMRKYHEGATLEEGPVLERIRRDGVVLNYHGLRFLLPRQQ
jgi:general secretion pathway protein B